MKKKIIVLVLLAALFAFGCGQKSDSIYFGSSTASRAYSSSSMSYDAMESEVQYMSNLYGESTTGGRDGSSLSEAANFSNMERKLVKTASIRVRVESLEKADDSLSILQEKYNAYSASTNISENSHYYSLRVPAPHYEAFLAEMNGIGRLIERYENTEDVTLRYYDLEGRLDSKKELLNTFQSYLRRANNIEEILSVEARIAELQYDIESTGTQLRHLANRVDYATIDLFLLGPVASNQYQEKTLAERIKQLFGGFSGFLSTVAVGFVGFVIYGIPSLALLILLFWVLFGRIGLAGKLWGLIKRK